MTSYLNSAHPFSYKVRPFPARDAVFGDFCDDNVCACAVGALILHPITNASPGMDLAIQISYKTRTFRL